MSDPWAAFNPQPAPASGADPWAAFNPQPQANVGTDIAKSFGGGLAKGAIGLAGLPSDAATLLNTGIDKATGYIGSKLGLSVPPPPQYANSLGSASIQKGIENIAGPLPTPQTTAGKYAQTVGEFAPAMIGGPEGLASKFLTRAALPGVASEAAGQATEGTAAEPYARVAGAVAGGLAPSLGRRIATPFPIAPERQASVDTLRNAGVTDLSAGQVTGNKGIQYLEEPGMGRTAENQKEQFTHAALAQVGENANRATPEVIDRAFTRIGGEFDRLSAQNSMNVTPQVQGDIQNAVNNYLTITPPAMRAPIVENLANDIGGRNVLTGDVYQNLRSQIDRAARGSVQNPQLSGALFDIRNALDDGMEQSLRLSGNVQAVQDWQQARRQYRNMLVVEKAATGAGADTAEGLISPAQLRQATVAQNRRAYARGQGDFADLARAGVNIMPPLPNSGTAQRLLARTAGAGLGGLAGSGEGPEGAGVGATIGAVGGPLALAGLARMARPYLANQAMANAMRNAPPASQLALRNAMMGLLSSSARVPNAGYQIPTLPQYQGR